MAQLKKLRVEKVPAQGNLLSSLELRTPNEKRPGEPGRLGSSLRGAWALTKPYDPLGLIST
jgi:hypothetical protein